MKKEMKERIQMSTPKVSIIIPVYNTADFLEQCIRSAIEQSWSNIEILLIDDGSTDGSRDICGRWEQKDGRIRFYPRKHMGQGMQRDYGIRKSTGDYIMFLDSDDYLSPVAVEMVVGYISQKKAQICFFSHKIIDCFGNTIRAEEVIRLKGCSSVRERTELLGYFSFLLWNKCYEGEFLRNSGLKMENLMCEDLLFLAQLIEKAERICTLDEHLYYYHASRERNFSAAYDRFEEVISVIDALNGYYKENGRWNQYWRQLYRVSHDMCKDIFTRLKERKGIPFALENAELIREFEECMGKWYAEKLSIAVYKSGFAILGSSNLTNLVDELCMSKARYVADYTGKCILSQAGNIICDLSDVDYVFIDFLEDIEEFIADENSWKERILETLKKIENNDQNSSVHIVVVENYLCEKYGRYLDGLNDFADIDRIRNRNLRLKEMYLYIEQYFGKALFVHTEKLGRLRYSDLDGSGGGRPDCYNRIYNGNAAIETNVEIHKANVQMQAGITHCTVQPLPSSDRYRIGFGLLNRLMYKTQHGIGLNSYFRDNHLERIAIYGMGALGERLYDEISKTDVTVSYAIDRMAGEMRIQGLTVMDSAEKHFPDVDAIIVTPVQDYWDIVHILEEKTDIPIVSLEDVIDYEKTESSGFDVLQQ